MQKQQTPQGQEMQEELLSILQKKASQLSEHQLQLKYTYSNRSSNSQFSLYEAPVDHFEVSFVRDEQLFSSLIQKLQQIKKILCIQDDDIILYLFYYYKWSYEKLINDYFVDDWSFLQNNPNIFPLKNHKIVQTNGICSVCLTKSTLIQNLLCPHSFCQQCWTGYIYQSLLEGQIFFGCMCEQKCQKSPVLKLFVDMIAPGLSELYRKKICMNYALQDKSISYCISQKCPYFCIKPQMMQLTNNTCLCGKSYCFKCQSEIHYPVKCSQVVRWNKMINSEQTNNSWIKSNTKICPTCKTPIEKKVGCPHIKCLCGCQFCYECNDTWNEAHIKMKNECPYRQNLVKNKKQTEEIVLLNKKINKMLKEAEKNISTINNCKNLVKEQTLKFRLQKLRCDVFEAWMTLKWTLIYTFMEKVPDIEIEIELEYITSIRQTMEPIELIIKNYNNLPTRELYHYGEQVMHKQQNLKNQLKTWLEIWRSMFSTFAEIY